MKKILKVDYPRGSATGYYASFIPAQKLKIKFSLFHPTINLQLPVDISTEIQERVYGTLRQSLEKFF
jgi:hypothetical protein